MFGIMALLLFIVNHFAILKNLITQNIILFYINAAMSLILYLLLLFSRSISRMHPINFVILGVFILGTAYCVSFIQLTFFDINNK